MGAQDLSNRVEVVHAYSPTAARRTALGRNFDFPLTERCEGRDVCQSIAINICQGAEHGLAKRSGHGHFL